MTRYLFISAILAWALSAGAGMARDLQVEVDVLHVGGQLPPAELEAMLADPKLAIEAHYQPTRLIEGETARRERTMPFGSKLFAISQQVIVEGAQIERKGRTLRFQLPGVPAGHDQYRLGGMLLVMPVAPGEGRPQPVARVTLYEQPPAEGAVESARFGRYGAFDLGLRVRHRWSDAKGAVRVEGPKCQPDIHWLGDGRYRFRPRHSFEGMYRVLASVAHSDPPSRPPAGQKSWRMREPLPEPIAGWQLSRNHLVQLPLGGQTLERLSVYAEQAGAGACRRTRAYDALYAGGQPVVLRSSISETDCKAPDSSDSRTVETTWAEDGSLARFIASSPQGVQEWDRFDASVPASCGASAASAIPDEANALKAELARFRDAFLKR
jgi:hypothetical protein